MFIVALFRNQKVKITQMSNDKRMDEQNVLYLHTRILLSH